MARPEPREMPEGTHAEAVPDTDWRLVTGKRCRFSVGHKACGRPSVAELNRRSWRDGRWIPNWWAYCDDPDHLYGRWIEDGQVMHWIAEENDA